MGSSRAHNAAMVTLFCAPLAAGGVVVGSGDVGVFGITSTYTSWNVTADPAPGLLEATEGRATGLEFHNGRLYMLYNATPIDGGPVAWTPGSAGQLTTPSTLQVSRTGSIPPSDVRRRFLARSLTVNTSGAGFGASDGSEPTLVLAGKDNSTFSAAIAPMDRGGPVPVLGAMRSAPGSRTIEFVPELGQFVSVDSALVPPDQTPVAASRINFSTHDAAGIAAPFRFFEAGLGIRAVQSVSAPFASLLAARPLTEGALLCLGTTLDGSATIPQLILYSYEGTELARGGLALPRFDRWPDSAQVNPSALAVDETAARLYVADRANGEIHSILVPSPGAAATLALCLAGLARARRRRP